MGSIRACREIPAWLRTFGARLAREGEGEDHVRSHPCEALSIFESLEKPEMRLEDYVFLMYTGMRQATQSWGVAAVLLTRLKQRGGVSLNPYTVHRLLVTALVIADKSINDMNLTNGAYSRLGLVALQDLNEMERVMLSHLNFEVFVSAAEVEGLVSKMSPKRRPRRDSEMSSTSIASSASCASLKTVSTVGTDCSAASAPAPVGAAAVKPPAFRRAQSAAVLIPRPASFAALNPLHTSLAKKSAPAELPPLVLCGRRGPIKRDA